MFETTFQEFIYQRTYARWLEDQGRREFWPESVQRYEDFCKNLVPKSKQKEFQKACEAKRNAEVMGSMRLLWTAGRAAEREGLCAYNCAAVPIDSIKSFAELLYLLMNGAGVGYSVERQYVNQLPEVPELEESEDIVTFPDSKLGWAEGFYKFIKKLYSGKIPQYDLSKIRPKGTPLKTFGGRASGPDSLENLLKFSIRLFKNAVGRKLSSLECNDLCCYICSIVMVGGVRRSAGASLSNPSDDRMRHAKDGQFWKTHPYRALANNSIAYTEKPDSDAFLSEFLDLIRSGSGERGIFNREACEFIVRQLENRKPGFEWMPNPCFTGDTKLLTNSGYKTFAELENARTVDLINADGNLSLGRVWCSGVKPTYELCLAGSFSNIKCTKDHEFMLNDGTTCEASQTVGCRLMPYYQVKTHFTFKDDFFAGFMLGDGSIGRLNSEKHKGLEVHIGKDDLDIAELLRLEYGRNYSNRAMYVAKAFNLKGAISADREFPEGYTPSVDFLSGLFSANGTIIESVGRVAYKTTSVKLASQLVQELSRVGIESYVTTNRPNIVEHKNGVYTSRESFDVNIQKFESLKKFAELISFGQKYKQDKLDRAIRSKGSYVKSVRYCGEEKVYDFSEPITNWGVVEGVVAHNCFEIILRPRELCNLTEVIIRPDDTKEDLCRKVRQAAILGCVQSLITNFNFVSREWRKNAEEERLIGASLTGLRDHPVLGHISKEAKLWLTEMKQVCSETVAEWAKALEINTPASYTCVKPSGTVSSLCNTSSGLHPRFAQYYIRRVRVSNTDPIANLLRDYGVPHHPEVGQTTEGADTWVFEFPIKSPDTSVLQEDVGAINQLEYWLMLQQYWCTHKPSCTIHVDDEEWPEVAAWVYNHWNYMSGVSFLPKMDAVYELMPFEEIDENEYNRLISEFPSVDFTELSSYEDTDRTEGAKEYACVSGNCEL